MKKAIMLCGVIFWWIMAGILSKPISNVINKTTIFSNKHILQQSNNSYSIILSTPFLVSNALSSFLAACLISFFVNKTKPFHVGILFVLFGSTPFVLMSSDIDKVNVLIIKLIISGVVVFIFSIFGGIAGKGLAGRSGG